MEKDPICGMLVKTDEAAGRSEYQGKSYFFCAVTCKDTFDRSPERYAVKRLVEQETVTTRDDS
jgi:P-type Cu+ transporter